MEVEGAMKVQNTTIFMGDNTRRERQNGVTEEKSSPKNIFAGNFNKKLDPIAQKKQQARQQAMKVVGDAWEIDRKIDQSLEDSRNRIKEYQDQIGNANAELKRIEEERLELRDSYGVEEDSQEEKDLQLLVKRVDSQRGGSDVHLTEEEYKRLAQIDAQGLTEYQQRSLDKYKSGDSYAKEITEAEQGIQSEDYFIRETKRELLKSQNMIKAQKSADDIMEAASQEIIGMLIDEAKDHIDEEMEEKKEAAEEKAEKEKEEEEKIEKIKEDKAEKEEFAEGVSEQVEDITKYVVEMEDTMGDVQQEIKKIMDEMKLLEEDLKGAAVDTVG